MAHLPSVFRCRNCIVAVSVLLSVILTVTARSEEEPLVVTIPEIQGASHCSPLEGRFVETGGIVTAVLRRGFFLQDQTGDGRVETSDGLFVFTDSAPGVVGGDAVRIRGTVTEFVPSRRAATDLTRTEIERAEVPLLATNRPLPAAVLLGSSGRAPPTRVIDDDRFLTFDPDTDGIDFFESVEGMRVQIERGRSVSPTNRFGETFVLADDGVGSTGMNARGGITISAGDPQPERIQIQALEIPGSPSPAPVDVGTTLRDIEGVMAYEFGNFEILLTSPYTVGPSRILPEETRLTRLDNAFTVATLNVRNLDPKVERRLLVSRDTDIDDDRGDGKFAAIAVQIVRHMGCPDVVALQEIQDNDGAEDTTVVEADQTLDLLVAMIRGAGGPLYDHTNAPPADDRDGGQPGGNIRVAFLYDPSRVSLRKSYRLVDDDLTDGDAFEASRKPLIAAFEIDGTPVWMVNNHFISRWRSTPLFGRVQPIRDTDAVQRAAQARCVLRHVQEVLSRDGTTRVIVLGDFNARDYEMPIHVLTGMERDLLYNLVTLLPTTERYTSNFEGNAQALDHILVSAALVRRAEVDIVHTSSEFVTQATDHDPIVARLRLRAESVMPVTFGTRISRNTADRAMVSFEADLGRQVRVEVTPRNRHQDVAGAITLALLSPRPPFVARQMTGSPPLSISFLPRAQGEHRVLIVGRSRHGGPYQGRLLVSLEGHSSARQVRRIERF